LLRSHRCLENWRNESLQGVKEFIAVNHFIIPTKAHNFKKVVLLKYIKIVEAAPTCFGLQRNHHQGAIANI
jgi:hypothetical protein